MNENTSTKNREVVRRFNEEVIGRGDERAFHELVAPEFVNRTAPPGFPEGPEGMWRMFHEILRPALPDLSVEIHDQLVDGDRVVTRKTLRGTHRGALLGVPATGRAVAIDVIDVVRVADGRYVEHWGVNTLGAVLADLARG